MISEEPEAELRRDLTSTADGAPKLHDPLQLSLIERIYQRTVTEIRLPTEDLSMQLMNNHEIANIQRNYSSISIIFAHWIFANIIIY